MASCSTRTNTPLDLPGRVFGTHRLVSEPGAVGEQLLVSGLRVVPQVRTVVKSLWCR
jgi:hypothetical protein